MIKKINPGYLRPDSMAKKAPCWRKYSNYLMTQKEDAILAGLSPLFLSMAGAKTGKVTQAKNTTKLCLRGFTVHEALPA